MKYAIISDLHANTEALEVVLAKCREEKVDEYICLGDIVGYNANPSECLEIVRSLNCIGMVKGNHDEYASNGDELMFGFNPHAREAVLWTVSQLSEEQREWLSVQPMRQSLKGMNMTLVHASLDSPESWGYIFDTHHAADNFSYQFTQLCFCGHSHVPLAFCKKPITMRSEAPIEELPEWRGRVDSSIHINEMKIADSVTLKLQTGWKYLINVGSVGQPRNRDVRSSFAIYDDVGKTVTRWRLPYDYRETQRKIREAGLPERLALRLENGT